MKKIIICDIDGTIAKMNNRGPFEWDKVGYDEVNWQIVDILKKYSAYTRTKVFLVSGRNSICRELTQKWLKKNKIPFDMLFMRGQGDNRKDTEIKQDIYNFFIKDMFDVLFVLDDRNKMVEMWRSLGLTCLQVANGDF